MIPSGRREAVLDVLDSEGIDYALTDETSQRGFVGVVTFPLPTEAVEPTLESLRDVGIDPEDAVFISAEAEKGLDALRDRIWDELGLIRIYMDKPGRGVDYDEPLILTAGDTVGDACEKIGGRFDDRFRFARVSGESAAHEDQQVGRDHELADEDVLRLIIDR